MSLEEELGRIDRKLVIDDTVNLIDEEVARKSGISGVAIKGGYKVVKKLKGGRMIEEAVDHLLDEFTGALDPLYQSYLEDEKAGDFEAYLSARKKEATNALLSITDKRAKRAENRILVSTYKKLRGQAEKHVEEALPGVGRLIDRHAPRS